MVGGGRVYQYCLPRPKGPSHVLLGLLHCPASVLTTLPHIKRKNGPIDLLIDWVGGTGWGEIGGQLA